MLFRSDAGREAESHRADPTGQLRSNGVGGERKQQHGAFQLDGGSGAVQHRCLPMRNIGIDWTGADGISKADPAYAVLCQDAQRTAQRGDERAAGRITQPNQSQIEMIRKGEWVVPEKKKQQAQAEQEQEKEQTSAGPSESEQENPTQQQAGLEEGSDYRLIFGYTEDVSRFNYGFVHGSKTKIGNLIVGWNEANQTIVVVPTVPDLSGCGDPTYYRRSEILKAYRNKYPTDAFIIYPDKKGYIGINAYDWLEDEKLYVYVSQADELAAFTDFFMNRFAKK